MSNSSDLSEAETIESNFEGSGGLLITDDDTDVSSISGGIVEYELLTTPPLCREEQITYKEQMWFDIPQMFKLLRNIENYIRAKQLTFVTFPLPRHDSKMLTERYPYIKQTLEAHYPIILPEMWSTKGSERTIRMTGEIKWRVWTLKEIATLKLRRVVPMVKYPQSHIEEIVLNRALEVGPYVPNHQLDKAIFLWLRSYFDGRLVTTALHTSTRE